MLLLFFSQCQPTLFFALADFIQKFPPHSLRWCSPSAASTCDLVISPSPNPQTRTAVVANKQWHQGGSSATQPHGTNMTIVFHHPRTSTPATWQRNMSSKMMMRTLTRKTLGDLCIVGTGEGMAVFRFHVSYCHGDGYNSA